MIGPKLDARSYTNLILVVIALLLALNLVAQQPPSSTLYTPEAQAIQQVATSVSQVAASNQQVAASLNSVADSISSAGDKIAAAITRGGEMGSPTGSSSSSAAPSQYQGTIEVNK